MDKLPDIHKIAVLRATNLGDYIGALPALEALRETYPDAEIVYLGKPFHKALIESRPGPVDRAIVIPVTKGIRYEPNLNENKEEIEAFLQQMRQERFDLAIQMHGGGENSNPFIKQMGARFTAGMRISKAPELDRWIPYVYCQSEFLRLLELVKLVGAQPRSYEPRLAVTENDRAEVRHKLPELGLPFAVLHPGASDTRRCWPAERFAQVGDTLAERGLYIVVTGTQHERSIVDSVISKMRWPAINACERLSIGGLAALLQSAAIMISNDTGPMHVANAVGAPNVGIFWWGNAFNWGHPGRTKQRQFLLDQVTTPYALFIDDDLIVEPDALERMLTALVEEGCGFVGCAVPGLSYLDDVRPHQQHIEFWEGNVQPEVVRPNTAKWERHKLHNAANILHIAQQMHLTPKTQRKYKLAWVGACVMYDTGKLRDCGGFDFWEQLPDEHCGEDILAEVRVMERYGGCGIIPTRVYHQEHPTTIPNRKVDAPKILL